MISIARIESGSSLFLHIRDKSGLLFKATHGLYGQSFRGNSAGHCKKCHHDPIVWFVFFLLQEAIQVDGDVLFGLLKKTQPSVYKHIVSYVY